VSPSCLRLESRPPTVADELRRQADVFIDLIKAEDHS
jgi:hypothetical protein